jgi:hypothetical protein
MRPDTGLRRDGLPPDGINAAVPANCLNPARPLRQSNPGRLAWHQRASAPALALAPAPATTTATEPARATESAAYPRALGSTFTGRRGGLAAGRAHLYTFRRYRWRPAADTQSSANIQTSVLGALKPYFDVPGGGTTGYGEIPGVGTRHLLQESGSEIRRSVRSAGGALRGATSVFRSRATSRRPCVRARRGSH